MFTKKQWRAALDSYDDDKEFPSNEEFTWDFDRQVMKRKLKTVWSHFAQDAQFIQVNAFAAMTVFSIGFAEAFLLMNKPRGLTHLRFAVRYATTQILPSVIWMTKDPHRIVRSMGYAPSSILRVLKSEMQDHETRLLNIETLPVGLSLSFEH